PGEMAATASIIFEVTYYTYSGTRVALRPDPETGRCSARRAREAPGKLRLPGDDALRLPQKTASLGRGRALPPTAGHWSYALASPSCNDPIKNRSVDPNELVKIYPP